MHRKAPVPESRFNNVAGFWSLGCSFIKKRLWHRCFPANLGKFLRTSLFTEHLRWLLLSLKTYLKVFCLWSISATILLYIPLLVERNPILVLIYLLLLSYSIKIETSVNEKRQNAADINGVFFSKSLENSSTSVQSHFEISLIEH